MAAVAAAAKAEGRTFLWWCSKEWNREAQAFYAGLGAIEETVQAHARVRRARSSALAAGLARTAAA